MTPEQYGQWKDFAFRFAKVHYAKRQHPSLSEIEGDLEAFFKEHESQIESINDWMDICDYVSDLFDCVWSRPYQYVCDRHARLLDASWERDDIDVYDALKEEIVSSYEAPVHCCLRSGLDLISGDVGVLGFTAGDIQKLYPEGLPGWIDDNSYIDKRTGERLRFSQLPEDALVVL